MISHSAQTEHRAAKKPLDAQQAVVGKQSDIRLRDGGEGSGGVGGAHGLKSLSDILMQHIEIVSALFIFF